MTEPIKNVTFGGLTFNENLVSSKKKNEDGTYTIIFKSGKVRMTYPEQQSKKSTNGAILQPEITRHKYKQNIFGIIPISYWSPYKINNVTGATFEVTKTGTDHIVVDNCNDCTINTSGNGTRLYSKDRVSIFGGKGNEVITDNTDVVSFYKVNSDTHMWEGVHIKNEAGTIAQDSYDN